MGISELHDNSEPPEDNFQPGEYPDKSVFESVKHGQAHQELADAAAKLEKATDANDSIEASAAWVDMGQKRNHLKSILVDEENHPTATPVDPDAKVLADTVESVTRVNPQKFALEQAAVLLKNKDGQLVAQTDELYLGDKVHTLEGTRHDPPSVSVISEEAVAIPGFEEFSPYGPLDEEGNDKPADHSSLPKWFERLRKRFLS